MFLKKPAGPGANCHSLKIGQVTLYFSFDRLIGFKDHYLGEVYVLHYGYAPTERHAKHCGLTFTEEDLVRNGGHVHHLGFDRSLLDHLALRAIAEQAKEN